MILVFYFKKVMSNYYIQHKILKLALLGLKSHYIPMEPAAEYPRTTVSLLNVFQVHLAQIVNLSFTRLVICDTTL